MGASASATDDEVPAPQLLDESRAEELARRMRVAKRGQGWAALVGEIDGHAALLLDERGLAEAAPSLAQEIDLSPRLFLFRDAASRQRYLGSLG